MCVPLSRGFSKFFVALSSSRTKVFNFLHAVRKGSFEIRLPWRVAGVADFEPGCYLRVDCRSRVVPLQSRFLESRCTRRVCILSVNGKRESWSEEVDTYSGASFVATIIEALLNSAQPDLVFNRRAVWRVITFLIDISHYRDFTRRSEMLRINCILGISWNALLRCRNDAGCNKPRNNRLILNSFLGHWICGKLCQDNLSILEFKRNFYGAVSRIYGVNQRVTISKCHLVEIITINRNNVTATPHLIIDFLSHEIIERWHRVQHGHIVVLLQ